MRTGLTIRTRSAVGLLLLLTAAAGCSGGSPTSATPPAPTPPPVSPTPPAGPAPPGLSATITITANNTFVPSEVRIAVGGRVTFINQNNRAHDITSDPLHLHTDCPPVIEVGFIQPGQTKQTGPLTVARTCGFHDHMQETNPDLHGRIIVQ
jgi:plastocyanin